MKMPTKKTFTWGYKPVDLLSHKPLVLVALCLVLLCASYTICDADVAATSKAGGEVILIGWSGSQEIYRSTSPLQGREVAELGDAVPGGPYSSPWSDTDTSDGTEYYYAVNMNSDTDVDADETASAIADRTAPRIENIAALPSPFSPDGDGYEDTTMIFFTLTEATYVTLKVYTESGTAIRTLLDGTELRAPGDNFVLWDGTDDTDLVDGIADDGRYLYRFVAAENEDVAENTLIQDISGDVIVLTAPFELIDISVTPTPFSPNGDKIQDCTNISYEITADADYVAGNIFAVTDGEQEIVAQIFTECLYYDWDYDISEWVVFDHVDNGIRAGLSSEMYYFVPVNNTLGPGAPYDPPFDVRDKSNFIGVETIADYWLSGYPASNPNWVPVSYDLVWCGAGATDATTYIVSLEAARTDGSKTLAKTHEIIIENPTIIPNDKTPPLVVFTYPRENAVHNMQLSYVQAFLDDGQGTGEDLSNSTISLVGPAGQKIPGLQSNDSVSALTWRLQEALADNGSDDGIYTIVVSAIDYARNRADNLQFKFEYNMRSNDQFPPSVDGLPDAIAVNGDITPFSSGTLIEPTVAVEAIVALEFRVCDGENGSGIDLQASQIELEREGQPVGLESISYTYDGTDCGYVRITLAYPPDSLAMDGTEDGEYILRIISVDIAENSSAQESFSFRYKTVDDLVGPSIDEVGALNPASVTIDSDTGSSPFELDNVRESVAVIYASTSDPDSPSGLSANSYIELSGPDGETVPGISFISFNIISFTLDTPLAGDGAADGDYNVAIYAEDSAGNFDEATATFYLNTFIAEPQAPRVVSVWPEDGAVINEPITEVYIVIEDRSGAGIDFERSDLDIDAPPGVSDWVMVSGELEFDEETNTITRRFRQSLATDGRSDGEYEIRARAYDNEGRRSERFYSSFIYDTQPPEVYAVEMGSRPWVNLNDEPITGLRGGGTNRPLTRVTVKLEDALSDIDLDRSSVEISGIEGIHSHDGIDTVIFDFAQFLECDEKDGCDEVFFDGCYEIIITAVDTLGNSSADNIKSSLDALPYKYAFIYDSRPPEIECALAFNGDDAATVQPDSGAENCLITDSSQVSQVLSGIDRIKVRLKDPDVGVGVDLIPSADALFIYGPLGQTMQGRRSIENGDTLVFTFDTPFSTTNSTSDGLYTVKTTAVDLVGNMTTVQFSFEYNALAPLLSDIEIWTSDDEVFSFSDGGAQNFERSVTQLRVILEDRSGKGIDFDDSFVTVIGPGASDSDMTFNDEIDTIIYVFDEPLANNGTDDSRDYIIFIRAEDNDGHWAEYPVQFFYDTLPPEVISTIPADGSIFNEPLSLVSATIRDATSQVDLFDSKINLDGPVSIAAAQVNNGVDTIELRFFELPSNGTADGAYEISVDPRDILGIGYAEPLRFTFIYDTKAPEIVSTEPAIGEVVMLPLERVVVVLTDGESDEVAGIDLNACTLKLLGPDGSLINGQLSREAPDTLSVVLDTPLADDGTADGTYTMRVTTQDQIGNVSELILLNFAYAIGAPRIVSTVPADGSSTAVPISAVSVTLADESGTGLDQENSQLSLLDPIGQLMAGELIWSRPDTMTYMLGLADDGIGVLATDGSDDGVYTLDVIAADNTGVVVNYKTTFVYDTTSPVVISTLPADGDVVSDSMDSVSAQLRDSGAGIDLVGSTIELFDPMGNLAGTQSNDGVNTIGYEFEPLPVDSSVNGEYVIRVTPADLVGNSALEPFSFSFIYDTTAPVVERTFPAEGSTIVVGLDGVSAQLTDGNGIGLDLKASKIRLRNPFGQKVIGVKSDDGVDTLFLTFPPLPADGSRDGEYTITVVGQDLVGNTSASSIAFLYKALAPELVDIEVSSEDATLSLSAGENTVFERSVTQVSAILEDRSRSGDGLDFEDTVISIEGPAVSELDVVDNNGEDTITYFFAEPLANNGSDDGEYLVYVKAVDNDGQWAEYFAVFFFDTTAPEVLSVTPDAKQTRPTLDDRPVPILSDPLSEVTVTMSDAQAGVDLFESKVSLRGVSLRSSLAIVADQVNNGVDTVALRFFELPSNGSADGLYEISVDPEDILGNDLPEPLLFSFIYDTTPPMVVSTEPDSGEVVAVIERVSVKLTDEFSQGGSSLPSVAGLDLDSCTLELVGPGGEAISGALSREEPDTLFLEPALTNGGLADGTYAMRIVTEDLIGNVSQPILVSFTLITRAPVVLSTTPADGDQLGTPVSHVSATLLDNSGIGLNLESSMVTLIGPDGEAIPGTHSSSDHGVVTHTLDNPLATDGSDDGVYALDILAVDNSGASVSHRATFTYDTTPPAVVLTSPADGDAMKASIDLVYAQLADSGSGVSLDGSIISLTGPVDIIGVQVNDGIDTIKYEFAPLSGRADADGRYTVSVMPVDMVGNAPAEAHTFSFTYDTTAPVVKRTEPADGSAVVVELDRVSVQMDDGGGVGEDIEASSIRLRGPDGRQISGMREDGPDSLVLTFPALAIDGSDNGTYTATVVLRDKLGNASEELSFQFTYLPTAPGVVALTPEDGSFIATPAELIAVTLSDKSGSGIDFNSSWVKLLGPDGQEVPGQASNDGVATLFFHPQNSFATNGTDDGEYTVEIQASDNEKNAALIVSRFFYDTTPCTVSRVYVGDSENGITLEPHAVIPSDFGAVDRVSAVIDDAGIGVDLSQSKIQVFSPLGMEVNAEQQNNGVNIISLQIDTLIQPDGPYAVFVTPVDKLENVLPQEQFFSFIMDTAVPEIVASTPTAEATVVNSRLQDISIQLDDGDGAGIDGGVSLVQVSGPNGEVSGKLDVQCGDSEARVCTLLYRFNAPLALDASDDGEYVVKVWFSDVAGNGNVTADGPGEPAVIYFTYDTMQPGGPVINNMGIFPKAFSPNGDGTYDDTTISYVLSKDAKVELLVYSSSRTLVATLLDMEPRPVGMNSITWDGIVDGSLLSDGMYLIKIDTVDDRGLTGAVESSTVVIDTRPPSVDRPLVSNNPFTPDGDGFADAAVISFAVNGSEPEDSVAVAIYDQTLEKIASLWLDEAFHGDGEYSATWDGDGTDVDGEYTFIITAQDAAGNIREISGTVAMDKAGPVIELLTPPVYEYTDEMYIVNNELVSIVYEFHTNQTPIVLSGTATDWGGVRSVSMVETFTPVESADAVQDPNISNWTKMTFSGDKVDNDGDGNIDEEEFNDKDDDGDGLVDEDLIGTDGKIVNWIHQLVPQVDGKYLIRFRASDPIDHAAVHPQPLRLVYDTVPPLHVSTEGESPSSGGVDSARVRDGDLVTIVTEWDQPRYNVTVDFAELDSDFGEPLVARDRSNGQYAVDHVVSEDNTRPNGLKTIIIAATDDAGNSTVLDTFQMKLRNGLPTIVSLSSPDGLTSYPNGSTVRILAESDAPDLLVSADFRELDSKYDPENVQVTNNGDNTYLIEYTIDVENSLLDRANIPIAITVSDGLGSVSSEYMVSLDNFPPLLQMVRVKENGSWREVKESGGNVLSADAAFANGSTVELETVWDAPGYSVSADFSSMDSTYKSGAESVESPGQDDDSYVYVISYELSSANKTPDGEGNTVIINAVDAAGNKGEFILRLNLDNSAPDILSVTSDDDDNIYKNGDTVSLLVKLDARDYEVSADFSKLDSTYSKRTDEINVTDNGDGTYTVKYGISRDNTLGSDKVASNIKITVTAVDAVGNSSSDSSMTVELDNIPPKLSVESPESDSLVFEARIEVNGQTESDAAVTVEPKGVLNVTPDVPVDAAGKFSCPVALDIGANTVTVTAADVAGNLTIEKLTILYRPLVRAAEGGTVYLPENKDDGIEGNDTKVIVPPNASALDFSIEIVKLESAPPAVDNTDIGVGVLSPLVAYEFTLKDETGDQELSMAFVEPLQLHLQYQGLKNLDGPAVVFRWDGVRWNRIGGEEDRENEIVKITVNSLSIFGIFRGKTVTEFVLKGAFPNPFTPNDDGVNDMVSFYMHNPDNAETVIRIFDLRGALIRRLEDGLTSWDGLDDTFEAAEMGVYIYQVEVAGEVKGGTIVLAK